MCNTMWVTNVLSSTNVQSDTSEPTTFKVTVYFPGSSSESYEHVIDIVFNDGIIVLVREDGCVYYRAKHVKKWTAVKE